MLGEPGQIDAEGVCAWFSGRLVLESVDLVMEQSRVTALIGPSGCGKSTFLRILNRMHELIPGAARNGSITLDGIDMLSLPTWQRARAGLFLAMQHPIEVPGVSLVESLTAARQTVAGEGPGPDILGRLHDEAARIGFDERFLDRPLNVDLSGGERKRNETLQLGVLRPRFAVLDEIDSGLDVDALADVGRRVQEATTEWGLGVLAITHFRRLLDVLRPDVVHVLANGKVVATGGSELAGIVDRTGYAAYT